MCEKKLFFTSNLYCSYSQCHEKNMTQSKTKELIERLDMLEIMMEDLMGNMDKLIIIWLIDMIFLVIKEIRLKCITLSSIDKSEVENYYDVVNNENKFCKHKNTYMRHGQWESLVVDFGQIEILSKEGILI